MPPKLKKKWPRGQRRLRNCLRSTGSIFIKYLIKMDNNQLILGDGNQVGNQGGNNAGEINVIQAGLSRREGNQHEAEAPQAQPQPPPPYHDYWMKTVLPKKKQRLEELAEEENTIIKDVLDNLNRRYDEVLAEKAAIERERNDLIATHEQALEEFNAKLEEKERELAKNNAEKEDIKDT